MSRSNVTAVAFAATMALSGFLLFEVQLILAKLILPWFGGSASTWLVCSLFFQLALLAGYALAYAVAGLLRLSLQVLLLAVLLGFGVLLLPITPADTWKPDSASAPMLRILSLLSVSVGLPFLVLATTTPLLTSWLAHIGGVRPVRFFVASNVGSFLGLLTYPFLIEHLLPASQQARLWSGLFAVYAALFAACGLLAASRAPTDASDPALEPGSKSGEPFWQWVGFSTLGSAFMLATANATMQWSAIVPFLWVLPLAVYLLTFVLAFAYPQRYDRVVYGLAFLVLACATPFLTPLPETAIGLLVRIAHHNTTLLIGCMICHSELVLRQPSPARLPRFYLAMASGGALGGLCIVLLAPVVFNGYLEHPLTLGLIGAYAAAGLWRDAEWRRAVWFKVAAGVTAVVFVASLFATFRHELRASIEQIRNFYGVVKIVRAGEGSNLRLSMLQAGADQGGQYQSPERRTLPLCGLDEQSGLGLALAHHAKRRASGPQTPLRIGIIGLGAGISANLGRVGDSISYYELNPAVHELASRHFSFLRDSKAKIDVAFGDGRLLLERRLQTSRNERFDVLVLDAFRGAAPPLHLMTREAFAIYVASMADDGILAVNMELDTFNVAPLQRGLANALGLSVRWFESGSDDNYCDDFTVNWALYTKDLGFFRSPNVRRAMSQWPDGGISELVWTDADANLLRIINWRSK